MTLTILNPITGQRETIVVRPRPCPRIARLQRLAEILR